MQLLDEAEEEKDPAQHERQVDAPVDGDAEYVPAAHPVHALAPEEAFLEYPALHMHAVDDELPVSEIEFDGHVKHELAPSEDEYDPAGQLEQASSPDEVLKVPALHAEHEPPLLPEYPALHEQELTEVLPGGEPALLVHNAHVSDHLAPKAGE